MFNSVCCGTNILASSASNLRAGTATSSSRIEGVVVAAVSKDNWKIIYRKYNIEKIKIKNKIDKK